MEIIIAGTQSPLQTLINQACIGKDYYIPIFFAGKNELFLDFIGTSL